MIFFAIYIKIILSTALNEHIKNQKNTHRTIKRHGYKSVSFCGHL